MMRVSWLDLPSLVRDAIEQRTGPVLDTQIPVEGQNSAVALVLTTPTGQVFVKGLPSDHPGVEALEREAAVAPVLHDLAPELLWRVEVDGWNLLGFAAATGRFPDFGPGSSDVPRLVATLQRLAQRPCPDLPQLLRIEQRWGQFVNDPADLALLAGRTLLHTELDPDNVIVGDDQVWLIDWAYATVGAAFIEPACLVVRLVLYGHTPAQAEAAVGDLPAWRDAPPRAIDLMADVLVGMLAAKAAANPKPWRQRILEAAQSWRDYRA